MAQPSAIYPFPLSSLPQELIDLVIDSLDDKPALAACSLVCKACLPAARRNIFRTLAISKGNITKLRQLVDDQSSSALNYTRWIRYWWRFSGPERDAAFMLIRDIAAKTSVESLHISLHQHDFAKFNNVIPSLTCVKDFALHMPAVSRPCSLGDVISLVSALPLLHSLYLTGYVESQTALKMAPTTFPHVHTLGVRIVSLSNRSPMMQVLLSWLILQKFPALHTVFITFPSGSRHPLLHRFLQSLGPTLQHLYVQTANLPDLDLPTYTHLRTFYIAISSHEHVCSTLLQAVPRLAHLDAVWLDFTVNRSDLEAPGWEAVDAALLRLPPRLRLRIVVKACEWEDAVRRCLVQSFARGIVKVVHPHPDSHFRLWRPWLNCG